MRKLKTLATGVHVQACTCPRQAQCLAGRFMEERLFGSIDDHDRSSIWHWTSHAYSEMRQCDLECPATARMAEMIVYMHEKVRI